MGEVPRCAKMCQDVPRCAKMCQDVPNSQAGDSSRISRFGKDSHGFAKELKEHVSSMFIHV